MPSNLVDAREVGIDQLDGGELVAAHQHGGLGDGGLGRVVEDLGPDGPRNVLGPRPGAAWAVLALMAGRTVAVVVAAASAESRAMKLRRSISTS